MCKKPVWRKLMVLLIRRPRDQWYGKAMPKDVAFPKAKAKAKAAAEAAAIHTNDRQGLTHDDLAALMAAWRAAVIMTEMRAAARPS